MNVPLNVYLKIVRLIGNWTPIPAIVHLVITALWQQPVRAWAEIPTIQIVLAAVVKIRPLALITGQETLKLADVQNVICPL